MTAPSEGASWTRSPNAPKRNDLGYLPLGGVGLHLANQEARKDSVISRRVEPFADECAVQGGRLGVSFCLEGPRDLEDIELRCSR